MAIPHTPDVSTGMRRDYGQMRIVTRLFEPRNQIAGVECSVNLGTGGSGGGVIYGGGSSTTLEPSSTKGYVTSKELNPSTIAW